MLWYKAWLESRVRFAIAASILIGFCLFATLSHDSIGPVGIGSVSLRIDKLIYSGTAKGAFSLLSLFLGLGGLVRERARHTAAFTLSLPVTRFQIIRARLAMGLLQLAVLSLVPALLIPPFSWLAHAPFPAALALHYSLLWFVGGSVIFSLAYLLSVFLEGEYTAAVACYILVMLQALISAWGPLRPYFLNLAWTMANNGYPAHPGVSVHRLLELAVVATTFFALAAWRSSKQDF